MKHKIGYFLVAILSAGGTWWYYSSNQIEVLYSPRGGCTSHIIDEIGKAEKEVRVWSYSFTSEGIADALLRAYRRGVDVQIVIDEPSIKARASQAHALANEGVQVWADGTHTIQHQKVMLIDGKTLLIGSFNWTNSAETRNSEVLMTIRDLKPELAKTFLDNWESHKKHSYLLLKERINE